MSAISNIILWGYEDHWEFIIKGSKQHSAVCKVCKTRISEKSGTTSNFNKHLRRKHPLLFAEYRMTCMRQKAVAPDQSLITAFAFGGPSTSTLKTDDSSRQEAITQSIVQDLIIGCSLPLSILENPCFRHFLGVVDDRYTPVEASTICMAKLPQMVEAGKLDIVERLASASCLTVTVDVWSDRRTCSFLAVTAHMLSHTVDSLALESYTLGCRRFVGSHMGARIAASFDDMMDEFGIRNKVEYILTDSASNMKSAFKTHFPHPVDEDHQDDDETQDALDDEDLWNDLEEDDQERMDAAVSSSCKRRLSCFSHSLQLAIGDGLKETGREICLAVAKASKVTGLLHTSAIFRDRFEAAYGGTAKSIPAANTTRWNSTVMNVKAILSLDRGKLADVCDSDWEHLKFSAREWSQLTELVEVLEPFLEATDLTQSHKAVTISLVAPTVLSLYTGLQRMEERGRSRHCKPLVQALRNSLRVHFKGIFVNLGMLPDDKTGEDPYGDTLYLLACTLDPRFGTRWVDLFIRENAQEVKEYLKDLLLSEIEALPPLEDNVASTIGEEDDRYDGPGLAKVPRLFADLSQHRHHRSGPRSSGTAELDRFIDLCRDQVFSDDPLAFWHHHHQESLPKLFQLAKQCLTVVASSAPVECVFAVGGMFLRPHRSRLSSQTLSNLVFLKCNFGRVNFT